MTQFWAPDLDNPINKRFVADYRKKTGRYPTFYAAQSYDTIMLIDSAVTAVGGIYQQQRRNEDSHAKSGLSISAGTV